MSITSVVEILLLAYADDIVLLSDSPTELTKKLSALYLYCKDNKLTVNIKKTKIVIFHKGRNSGFKRFKSFEFGCNRIEVVKRYEYLGVLFDNSGSFAPNTSKFVSAANSAAGAILNTIFQTGADSWSVYSRLFNSLFLSTFQYAIQIWGHDQFDEIEKVQVSFLKNLLLLPRCTLHYAVRLETGYLPISFLVLQRTLS